MEKFKLLNKIKELYDSGENIMSFLRSGSDINTIEDILISYDFQSGSYIKNLSENAEFKSDYCKKLADTIINLGEFDSIMEIGVGEATTLSSLLQNFDKKVKEVLGFDISWSRMKFAKNFLKDQGLDDITLFTADLFEIPLADNSVDIVYTSHSIEPNGGREKEALQELYRVAKKYVVLLEPAFELATEEAQERMTHNGYVRNIVSTTEELGFNILKNELFGLSANPLNPTGLTIIEKNSTEANLPELVCPITKSKLELYNESTLYAPDSFLAYPVLDGIPCLLKDNSILAIHLMTDYNNFKEENNISY